LNPIKNKPLSSAVLFEKNGRLPPVDKISKKRIQIVMMMSDNPMILFHRWIKLKNNTYWQDGLYVGASMALNQTNLGRSKKKKKILNNAGTNI